MSYRQTPTVQSMEVQRQHMFQTSQIKTSVVWRIIEVVGAEFFAFCSFLMLTRLLAPEHFGVIALATIIILVAQLVLFQGIGEALVQREDIDDGFFSSAFWTNLILATMAMLLLVLLADIIARLFSEPSFGPVLRAMAPLLIIFAASGILQAKLRRQLQLKAFALASIVATLSGAVIAIMLALQDFGVWSLVGQQWAYATVSTAMFMISAQWLPATAISIGKIKSLAWFSLSTVIAAILRFSLRQVDVLMLGFYLASKQVGFYFLATRLLITVGQLTYDSIQKIGLPVLARLQDDLPRQHAAILSTLRLTCLVCLPIFHGLAMTADLFIPLVFGDVWQGSIRPFQILSLFSIFYALSLVSSQILLSAGRSSSVLRLSVVNALAFAVAVALAAPRGIDVTALAGGLANLAILPLYFWALRRELNIDLVRLGKDLLPIWTATLVMVTGLVAGRHYVLDSFEPLVTLVLSIMIGAVLFCGTVFLVCRDHALDLLAGWRSSKTPS